VEMITIDAIRNEDKLLVTHVGVFSDLVHVKNKLKELLKLASHDSI